MSDNLRTPNSDERWYVGTPRDSSKKAELRAVKVSGVVKVGLDDKVLKTAIEQVFASNIENRAQIELVSYKEGTLTYRVGEETKNVVLQEIDPSNQTFDVRELKVGKHAIPIKVRRVKWKKLYRRARQNWPTTNPVSGFIVKYCILPLLTTIRFLGSAEHAAVRLEKLMTVGDPKNMKELRSLLRHQKRMLERLGGSEEAKKLEDAITTSRRIEEAIRKGTLPELSEELAKSIDQLGETIIPGGYYDPQGDFRPVIYTLWHSETGNKQLHAWDLGGPDGSGAQETKWNITKVSTDNLTKYINSQLIQSLPGSTAEASLTARELGRRGVLREGAFRVAKDETGAGGAQPQQPLEDQTQYASSRVEAFLVESCATRIEPPQGAVEPPQDGWELMRRLMGPGDGDKNSMDTLIEMTVDVANEQVQLLHNASKKLKPAELAQAQDALKVRAWQLQDQMKGAFGDIVAFRDLVDQGSLLPGVVEGHPLGLGPKQKAKAVAPMPATPQVCVPQEERGALRKPPKVSTKGLEDVVQVHKDTLEGLQAQFAKGEAVQALKSYTTIASAIDRLVDKGRYNEALRLAEVVQDILPVPTNESSDLWSKLAENTKTGWNDLDGWGLQLDKVTKAQWESSLRLHRRHIEPREMVGMMNTRAVLFKIARAKSSWVQKKHSIALTDLRDALEGGGWENILEKKIPYEQVASLLFDWYQTDWVQFEEILKFHPHYRLTAYPDLEEKTHQVLEFFKAHSGGRVIIRMDAQVDAPRRTDDRADANRYSSLNDFDYCYKLGLIAKAYKKSDKDPWSNTKIQPRELQHLQRHTAMFQMMYRPEFSTALSFGSGLIGVVGGVSWWEKIKKRAAEETQDTPSLFERHCIDLAYRDLTKFLDKHMRGRLDLQPGVYMVTSENALMVVASRGNKKLYYLPWGLGFGEQMKKTFSPGPDDFYAANMAGEVPDKRLQRYIGIEDGQKVEPRAQNDIVSTKYKIEDSAKSFRPLQGYTEAGLLKLCQLEPSDTGVMDEYLLDALAVATDPSTSQYTSGPGALLEALELVCARPDLLSKAPVRQLIDLKVTSAFGLRELMEENPKALEGYGPMLKQVIEKQLDQNNVHAAAYLIHLAELLRRHAAAHGKVDIVEAMPGYETGYFDDQPGKQTTGIAALKTYIEAEPDAVRLSEIEMNMLAHREDVAQWVTKMEPAEVVNVLSYPSFVETLEGREGSPMFNRMLANWVEETLFPLVSDRLCNDQDCRNQVMNQLLGNGAKKGDWKAVGGIPRCVFQRGKDIIDVRTMTMQIGKQFTTTKPIAARIPSLVRDLIPELNDLVVETKSVQRTRGNGPGEWVYIFEHDQTPYEVRYDQTKNTAVLLRDFRHSDVDPAQWHRLYKPTVEGTGPLALIRQHGIWVAQDKPSKGVVLMPDRDPPLTLQSIFVALNSKGAVKSFTTPDGRPVAIPSAELLSEVAPTVHPDHAVYLPAHRGKPAELHLLDKSITLVQRDDKWQLSADALLVPSEEKPLESTGSTRVHQLMQLFGEGVAMRFRDPKTGGEQLLVWPHKIVKTKLGKPEVKKTDNYEIASNHPAAAITITSDGVLQASSASYLYLAYNLVKRKQYRQAAHMLEEAGKSSIETKADGELFAHIAELIRSDTPKVRDEIAFQIKFELLLLDIERQQLGIVHYDPSAREEYFANAERIVSLHKKWSSATRPDALFYGAVELSDAEEAQLQHLRREVFERLLKKRVETPPPMPTTLAPVTTKTLPEEFLALVATMMIEPEDLDPEKLRNPGVLTGRHVLSHFPYYYNQILTSDLKISDLGCLFQPLEDARQASLMPQEKTLVENADLARRILIQTALNPGPGCTGIDVEDVSENRKKLPKKLEAAGTFLTALKLAWRTLKQDDLVVPSEADFVIKALKRPVEDALDKQIEGVKGNRLGLAVLVPSEELKKAVLPPEGSVDINDALKNIDEISEDINFSPLEKKIFEETLKGYQHQEVSVAALNEILTVMNEVLGISPQELRREQELRYEVGLLEKQLAGTQDLGVAPNYTSAQTDEGIGKATEEFGQLDTYFEKADKTRETKLTKTIPQQIGEVFLPQPDDSAAWKEECQQIAKGAEEAVTKIDQDELKYNRKVKADQLDKLTGVFETELNAGGKDSVAKKFQVARELLVLWAKKEKRTPAITRMVSQPELYSDQDILDEVMDQYQMGSPTVLKAEARITNFLCYGTMVQQLKEAQKSAATLQVIQAEIGDSPTPVQENAFQEESRKLCRLMARDLNGKRYLDESGRLTDPRLNRKFLVSEYRLNIVLRDGQREKVRDIDANPNQWLSLRMGEGKTFYIMPVVAALLAETKVLPIMLVPSQLQTINKADFDRTTRALYGRRAEPFQMNLDKADSAAYLAGIYHHLLQVRRRGGYLVTSVDALAGITNLGQELREERRASLEGARALAMKQGITLDEFFNTDQGRDHFLRHREINSRLFWARKLELLIDGNPNINEAKVKTHLFGDEVDSILHISKEINRAVGKSTPLDRDVRNLTMVLFDAIFTGDAPNTLKGLAEVWNNGTQAALDPDKITKEILPALARQALKSDQLKEHLHLPGTPQILDTLDEDELVNYLTGASEELPNGLKWDSSAAPGSNTSKQQERIAALKHLISKTMPSLLSLEPGLKFVLSNSNGAIAVPAENGAEVEGSRFGDAYEVIAFQYLAHIQVADCQAKNRSTEPFYDNALRQIQAVDPTLYKEMEQRCREVLKTPEGELLEFKDVVKATFEKPELWDNRCKIVESVVFDGQMVTRYLEQITTAAQGVLGDRSCGGVTGTLNHCALPGFDLSHLPSGSTRAVEAETLVKTAANLDKGLLENVSTFDDASPEGIEAEYKAILQDPGAVAIINEGGYGMQGKTTTEWVREHRAIAPTRTFVWLEQVETKQGLKTKTFIWKPDIKDEKTAPQETTYRALKERKEPWLAVYGPQFTRGADLPLGVGNTHYLMARGSNLQGMGQSIWRGRGTGDRHTPKWHVPQSVAGLDPRTLGEAFKIIAERGVQEQGPLNKSAQQLRITELVTTPMLGFLNSFSERELDKQYWDLDATSIERSFALERFDDRLHLLFRRYFIADKSFDFESDFAAAKKRDTTDVLYARYDAEKRKLEERKGQLGAAAADVVFGLAEEAGKEEELHEQFKGMSQQDPAVLAAMTGLPPGAPALRLPSVNEGENDIAVGKLFMSKLFADAFDAYPKATGDRPMTTALEMATDKLEGRMVDYFIYQIPEEARTVKEKSSGTDLRKDIRKLLDKSIKEKGSFADLLGDYFGEISTMQAMKMGGLTKAQRLGVGMLGLFGQNKRIKKEIKKKVLSDENKVQITEFQENIGLIRKSKQQWSDPKLAPMMEGMQRMAEGQKRIDAILLKIDQEAGLFKENADEYAKYLPPKSDAATSTSGVQEQVQQQQQQQQTLAVRTPKTREVNLDAVSKRKFERWSVSTLAQSGPSSVGFTKPCADWGVEDIFVTKEAEEILKIIPSLRGDPIWKFAVDSKGNVTLLSKLDYHAVVHPGFSRTEAKPDLGVYTPHQEGLLHIDGPEQELDDPIRTRIAILKLRLGYRSFPDEERQLLSDWRDRLSTEAKKHVDLWARDEGIVLRLMFASS